MSVPVVSFEFFPPGDEAMAQQLWQSVQRLAPLRPSFVSVTYGADGSPRTRTHEFVQRVLLETDLRVAPHLTCVGAAREEVLNIAHTYWQLGVRHLVALRGDAPAANLSPEGRYLPHPAGFAYASDLVRALRVAMPWASGRASTKRGWPDASQQVRNRRLHRVAQAAGGDIRRRHGHDDPASSLQRSAVSWRALQGLAQ